jgi:23S rRNA (cytidine1920-2'-O)/16S rRNA (cytidine1409-2'-O)-methyltransferase
LTGRADNPKVDKLRLDELLVERGLAPSRTKAQALVLAGQVVVADTRVDKPGTRVPRDAEVRLKGEVLPFVSRGGLKLQAALDHFRLDPRGQVCADIGASTGGFTDCLLQRGAVRVHAIDVGYGQLHQKLRADPRVVSRERVNARHLTDEDLPEAVGAMVIDVSFISLKLVLPSVLPKLDGWLVALVKPQFEAGREGVGKGGVVRDAAVRAGAIEGIRAFVADRGLEVLGVIDSPTPGPAGNIEALLAARKRVPSPPSGRGTG